MKYLNDFLIRIYRISTLICDQVPGAGFIIKILFYRYLMA